MKSNFDGPKWEVVSEVDVESQRKRVRAKAHRLRGVYLVVVGIFLIAFAMGLAQIINGFSERFAEQSGNSHYSELLPSGAVLCGFLSVCKGLYKIIAGE